MSLYFILAFIWKGTFGIVTYENAKDTLSIFDTTTSQLRKLPALIANQTSFAVVSRGNEIVTCGGMANGGYSSSCYRLNINKNR